MLVEVKKRHGALVRALDGELGQVEELLFDEEHWTVRYLIVALPHGQFRKKVPISPMLVGWLDSEQQVIRINATLSQILDSPIEDTEGVYSRSWERDYCDYFTLPHYWTGARGWGEYWHPGVLLAKGLERKTEQQMPCGSDTHLRSTKTLIGSEVSATKEPLGHVEDLLLNDETWHLCYLAVNTQSWWPGKLVLLAPDWLGEVNWSEGQLSVHITHKQVLSAPQWSSGQLICRAFEDQLYRHYSRQRPWYREGPAVEMLKQSHNGAFSEYTVHGSRSLKPQK